MTCRCHNKTWTTALGCYSSSLLRLAAWASKSLDGFDGVRLDLSECVCARVCVCVERLCVRAVVFGGIASLTSKRSHLLSSLVLISGPDIC